jgi:hypothetical protein
MKHKTPPRIELPATPRTDAAFALRHTKTCSIRYFREVMEAMERDLIAAQAALKDATQPKTVKPSRPPADPEKEFLAESDD